jgi:hypothetical protein
MPLFSGQTLSLKQRKPSYADTVWIVGGRTALDDRYKKIKFDYGFDARQTLVSSAQVRLLGFRVGLEIRRVHRFGLGFYKLGEGVRLNSLLEVSPNIDSADMRLNYTSLYYERVLYFGKKMEWSATSHVGIGNISGAYRYRGTGVVQNFSRTVYPVELSSSLYFHLTYFMSVGVGLGYRYVPAAPLELRPIYNAPIAILRVKFRVVKMVRGIFNSKVRHTY